MKVKVKVRSDGNKCLVMANNGLGRRVISCDGQ